MGKGSFICKIWKYGKSDPNFLCMWPGIGTDKWSRKSSLVRWHLSWASQENTVSGRIRGEERKVRNQPAHTRMQGWRKHEVGEEGVSENGDSWWMEGSGKGWKGEHLFITKVLVFVLQFRVSTKVLPRSPSIGITQGFGKELLEAIFHSL